jgi:putative glutamine amidotransferase
VPRPVIGLTCYVEQARWGAWDQRAALIPWTYVARLEAAGARVVILPPDSTDADVLDRLDGLVISGGADVDPARYGQEPHATTDVPRLERDSGEVVLYQGARDRDLPVLGICRGLQVMAVAEGGSLVQHLPDVVGDTRHRDAPGTFNDHGATFAEGSLAAAVVGASAVVVNSSHHQSVADVGSLTATGWADDGTIETAEDPAARFVLGVQWHPEAAVDPAVSDRIFRALVQAAAPTPGRTGPGSSP